MNKNKFARIIPIALTLVIAAVIIAAAVSLVRFMFFPGSSTTTTTTNVNTSQEALLSTLSDRAVSQTVRGPIVADESFRSYVIKISPNSRNLTVYQGYLDQPIKTVSLGNNVQAYEQFVYALDKANMMKGVEVKGTGNDLNGICAAGSLFEYQTLKSDVIVKSLWTSTCAGSRGSLNASSDQLNNLFIVQIPGSKDIINQVWQ